MIEQFEWLAELIAEFELAGCRRPHSATDGDPMEIGKFDFVELPALQASACRDRSGATALPEEVEGPEAWFAVMDSQKATVSAGRGT